MNEEWSWPGQFRRTLRHSNVTALCYANGMRLERQDL